jgi:hypothetical protein
MTPPLPLPPGLLGTNPARLIVIAGGRVIDPETGLHAVRNVGIKGGRIAAISDKKLEGTKTLNADGQIVAPDSSTCMLTVSNCRRLGFSLLMA